MTLLAGWRSRETFGRGVGMASRAILLEYVWLLLHLWFVLSSLAS